ncbi:MAG: ABC transporter permease [Candidatus Omnitrophota bacterium]
MFTLLKRIIQHFFLLTQLVRVDLTGKYKTSVLGMLWIFLNPLILFFLYMFIFSIVLKVRFPEQQSVFFYGLNLFCGLIAWNAFAESIQRSSSVIMNHAHLIKRSLFPTEILGISISLSTIIRLIIEMALFIVLLTAIGWQITPAFLWLPFLVILQLLFTTALAWLVSAMTVLVRDLAHLVGPLLTVWFFMTPVVYPETMAKSLGGWQWLAFLIHINPMAKLISTYRGILLFGYFDFTPNVILLTVFVLVFFLLSAAVFQKLQPEIIENL